MRGALGDVGARHAVRHAPAALRRERVLPPTDVRVARDAPHLADERAPVWRLICHARHRWRHRARRDRHRLGVSPRGVRAEVGRVARAACGGVAPRDRVAVGADGGCGGGGARLAVERVARPRHVVVSLRARGDVVAHGRVVTVDARGQPRVARAQRGACLASLLSEGAQLVMVPQKVTQRVRKGGTKELLGKLLQTSASVLLYSPQGHAQSDTGAAPPQSVYCDVWYAAQS